MKPYMKLQDFIKKALKPLTVLLAIVVVILLVNNLVKSSGEKNFEQTMDMLAKFDEKHGTSLDDYKFGFEHLTYNPRFPDPINPGDIDALVLELEDLKKRVGSNAISKMLIDLRINLFKTEKYYTKARRWSKGNTFDGFKC